MSMRIALITYNWPPRNAIGTHRPYGWAKYWSRLGVSVTVITSRKKDFDEPLDSELPLLPGVRVIEVDYRPPLPGGGSAAGLFRNQRLIVHLKRINQFVRSTVGLVLDPRDGWAESARDIAASVASEVDVVISTFGPRSSHLIASRMKRQVPGLLWVADYRDLWSNSHMGAYGALARISQRRMEARLVGGGADLLTTVSEELALDLENFLRKKTFVVPNGFDAEEDVTVRRRDGGKRLVVYTGMLYQGTRDPSPLFSVLKDMHEQDPLIGEKIAVEFYGPTNSWLNSLVQTFGLEDVVKLRGRVSRREALSIQRSADALLLLESEDPAANGVLTGKLFEYLAAGRPILSLGSRVDSAIARVLGECQVGICAGGDAEIISRALRELIDDVDLKWFRPRAERIAVYSREKQAQMLLELVQEHLNSLVRIDSVGDSARNSSLGVH